jgi:hypothetical protein
VGLDLMSAMVEDTVDTQKVPYMNLGGGLNTLKAPHALERNELAQLVNAWYSYGSALSKRPGTELLNATGAGVGGSAVVACRFNDDSYLIVQQGLNVYAGLATGTPTFVLIGTVTGGILRGAQMYDPATAKDTVFLVTGHDTPQMWHGPTTTLVPVSTVAGGAAGTLPNKPGVSTPITPAYVATLGNNSHLFYSGEPTAPNAVYISDPFFPESFTTPAMQADPYGYTGGPGTFIPAIIGLNDGVDGGAVTALQTLGFAMLVFKESAIYAMVQTQLLGNVAWQVYNVCPSRGALSPRSVIPFDQFVAFLSIDGCYITFGQPNEKVTKISGNVPSYFDSSRFGQAALISNRTTAIAVRHANRYIVWFETGTSKPTTGVWFDFDVTADQQLPAAGEIAGMTMGGAVSLCGPKDDGNVAWVDAAADRVGIFGLGFFDFSAPIAVQIAGKADMFTDVFGGQAPVKNKVPARCDLIVATLSQGIDQTLQFAASFNTDFSLDLASSNGAEEINVPNQAGAWGDLWGAFNWSSAALTETGFFDVVFRPQKSSFGQIMQMAFSESSGYPWLILGYILELNAHEVSR